MVKPVRQLDKVHAPPVPTVAHCNLSEQRQQDGRFVSGDVSGSLEITPSLASR